MGRARGRRGRTVAVVLAVVTVAACGSSGPGASGSSGAPGRPLVVATTTQLADFARVVGGDDVQVVGLLKPNVDAHEYEASPADLDRISRAELVVRNGLGLDAWVDQALKATETKAPVVVATAGITPRMVDGEPDPHVWLDPRNAEVMVGDIATALAGLDAAHAPGFEARRAAYAAQLDTLDAEIAGQLARVTNRKVVTNHDAFGYYLDRYGLTFVGSVIPSFDTQAELSASELSDLVAAIRAQGVNVVFAETSLPPKAAAALAREAGVKVVEGAQALYGDSLGPAGSGADTYLGMMRHDTETFVDNLS